jgi:hypothetical protein
MEMIRMFIGGAAAALTVASAPWGGLQYTQPAKAAADGTLGMAIMSAIVDGNGALVNGVAVSSSRIGLGTYEVVFSRSVAGCTFNITAGNTVSQGDALPAYGLGYYPAAPDRLWALMRHPINGSQIDAPFHLLVFCHK